MGMAQGNAFNSVRRLQEVCSPAPTLLIPHADVLHVHSALTNMTTKKQRRCCVRLIAIVPSIVHINVNMTIVTRLLVAPFSLFLQVYLQVV